MANFRSLDSLQLALSALQPLLVALCDSLYDPPRLHVGVIDALVPWKSDSDAETAAFPLLSPKPPSSTPTLFSCGQSPLNISTATRTLHSLGIILINPIPDELQPRRVFESIASRIRWRFSQLDFFTQTTHPYSTSCADWYPCARIGVPGRSQYDRD